MDQEIHDRGYNDGLDKADPEYGFDAALVEMGEIEMMVDAADQDIASDDVADLDDADLDDADDDDADIDESDYEE